MTPKEKAIDLVHKFNLDNWDDAKHYALNCVDEKIETLKMVDSFVILAHTEEYGQFYKEELEELQDIKQEIEKL